MEHHLSCPAFPGPCSLDQITDHDRHYLAQLAKEAKIIIEIGTFLGGSAEVFAQNMPEDGHLFTLDKFQDSRSNSVKTVPKHFQVRYAHERLAVHGDRVTLILGDSLSCSRMFREEFADLIFIDGGHDCDSVKQDIEVWLPIVKETGLIIGHDYDRMGARDCDKEERIERSVKEWDEETGVHWGVIRAVDEQFYHVQFPQETESTLWIARPQWHRSRQNPQIQKQSLKNPASA